MALCQFEFPNCKKELEAKRQLKTMTADKEALCIEIASSKAAVIGLEGILSSLDSTNTRQSNRIEKSSEPSLDFRELLATCRSLEEALVKAKNSHNTQLKAYQGMLAKYEKLDSDNGHLRAECHSYSRLLQTTEHQRKLQSTTHSTQKDRLEAQTSSLSIQVKCLREAITDKSQALSLEVSRLKRRHLEDMKGNQTDFLLRENEVQISSENELKELLLKKQAFESKIAAENSQIQEIKAEERLLKSQIELLRADQSKMLAFSSKQKSDDTRLSKLLCVFCYIAGVGLYLMTAKWLKLLRVE